MCSVYVVSDFFCLCVRCLSGVALKSALPACVPLYSLAVSLASGREVSGHILSLYTVVWLGYGDTHVHNVCVCVYAYMCICAYASLCICMHMYMYLYMCIYVCVYIYVFAHLPACMPAVCTDRHWPRDRETEREREREKERKLDRSQGFRGFLVMGFRVCFWKSWRLKALRMTRSVKQMLSLLGSQRQRGGCQG